MSSSLEFILDHCGAIYYMAAGFCSGTHLTLLFLFYCNRGAALLVEAADMGDADAQYELGCRLRVEVKFLVFVANEMHFPIYK